MLERNKKLRLFTLILVLVLGFYVRHINYDVWPREGATFDEYAWPWLGINLIQHHIPISWSPHGQYQDAHITKYRDAVFRIVQPYLEHPPLFGLISGSYAIASGATEMFDAGHINPTNLRKLALFMGVTAILAMYLFTTQVYGYSTGLLSALLYAVVPSVAVGSRLLQNENFMIPVWLFTLYFLAKYLKNLQRVLLWLVVFLSAIMLWAKIPWFVIGASVCGILVYHRRWRECFFVGGGMLLSLSLFLLYGYFWDWDLFVSLWGLQLTRYDIGLASVLALFRLPYLTDRFLPDGWIYFGWIAMAAILKNSKRHLFIITPFLTYFLVYIWAIPGVQAQGWYRYPFYPFLTIAIAYLILKIIQQPNLLAIVFQLIVGSSMFKLGFEPLFGIDNLLFRSLLLLWSLPVLLYFFLSNKLKKLYRYSFLSWLVIFVILSISAAANYNEQ